MDVLENAPLVSVLVPSYNHERFVDDCIKSILDQTYPNVELIVCDDCSQDKTWEHLQALLPSMEQRLTATHISRNPTNFGLVENCNQLVRMSHGTYIKIIASDDMLMPDCLTNLVAFLRENKEYDLVYSNMASIAETSHHPLRKEDILRPISPIAPFSGKGLTRALCRHNFIGAPSVLIRRETFEKYGVFDPSYRSEDWQYWLRVSVHGNIGYLDACTVMYRQQASSTSRYAPTDKDRKRAKQNFADDEKLLLQYEAYCDAEAWQNFYLSRLGIAILLEDRQLAHSLATRMRTKNVPMPPKLGIKYVLLMYHLYRPVLDIVHKAKNLLGMQVAAS